MTAETGPEYRISVLAGDRCDGVPYRQRRERLLESSGSNSVNGADAYPMASFGGAYVGVVVDTYDDDYYGDVSREIPSTCST